MAGLIVSAATTLLPGNFACVPTLFALWALYHSLLLVGGPWYGFGWESQLLETGFIGMCAVPLFPGAPPPPVWFSMAASKWLLFRIMLGSGLIKLRGDRCWKCWVPGQRSCLEFFYETQPVPGPLARFLHFCPSWFHRGGTYTNHLVELVLIFFVLVPPLTDMLVKLSVFGGLVQLAFQAMLIGAGNLSFLNVLTMVPAIWCLNDSLFSAFVPGPLGMSTLGTPANHGLTPLLRHAPYAFLALLLAKLSIPVVKNMLSKKQVMNSSFEKLRLVNTYGAFGAVHQKREEIIISGAASYDSPEEEWKEYVFNVKPGPISRRLPFIVPYHYRLDWCVWLATLRYRSPPFAANAGPLWLPVLLKRLLENDPATTALFARGGNPFAGKEPPGVLKVDRYRYSFTEPGSQEAREGKIWNRELIGPFYSRQPIFTRIILDGY
eukprot:CAMPEP_0172596030 /NCGR_PEP_ID=MMETSP1068-20121228/15729_1 /TAXON_ID=35684 /ORGANISM="Pseudopedinella elastica, Strain CCMP716" /LENGTH=434 /DNA_ID=CAMNT_0013394861 /DNA_START=216 /DNA_END=1520 /DNA_ORIENTATION=-